MKNMPDWWHTAATALILGGPAFAWHVAGNARKWGRR